VLVGVVVVGIGGRYESILVVLRGRVSCVCVFQQ
jgi:hypothetical protein